MTDTYFAIPGDIATLTGGYAYDRRVIALLPSFGIQPRHLALPGSFPNPTDADLTETDGHCRAEPAARTGYDRYPPAHIEEPRCITDWHGEIVS